MTIKLPPHTTLSDAVIPIIGIFALFLCDSLGSKVGRWVFGASENAWTWAYISGIVLAVFFSSMVKRKPSVDKTLIRQYPLWVFLSVLLSSFLLCELFKVIHA